jgi:hypothetical protein
MPRRGRRPSSGESAIVPSVRAIVSPRCTARPVPVHWAWIRCTGFSIRKQFVIPGYFGNLAKRSLDSCEINPRSRSYRFCTQALGFSKNNPRSGIFAVRPKKLKNNSKKVPSLRKIPKNSPKTSKVHIFSTTTPNPVILAPKFLGSLSLSFCAFI